MTGLIVLVSFESAKALPAVMLSASAKPSETAANFFFT
ncbi:hypothetical protein E6C60_0101 [Paenibacillus algicola]|uniref:Uncharacterized protein n=1 Tax=Paenibacillus algicola TaxID=2565926 RepID=A0A4P8XF92_9BACL|nr:hypothetical protein E6C60_0101 [Paenibacillus algicola]